MRRISLVIPIAVVIALAALPAANAYVVKHGETTRFAAGSACVPGYCPPMQAAPMMGYGAPMPMQPPMGKPITKCKPPVMSCPPPMPMCPPPMPMCFPTAKRPVILY